MHMFLTVRISLAILVAAASSLLAETVPPVMPLPATYSSGDGAFSLSGGFELVSEGYSEPRLERAVQRFIDTLNRETGIFRVAPPAGPPPQIILRVAGPSLPVQQPEEDESYDLTVSRSTITLTAPNPLGILHGLQTLLQLVEASPAGFVIRSAMITDKPRFPWRGLMIDSGRHFIPPALIRQNLDAMEAVKLNVLHWHVSEDQGFRIESKVFPLLTGKGSDGLYYTQDEIHAIIDYARDRGIRVYPEFDMPSHAGSFYLGYPELADGAGPYHLKRRFGEKWGRERKPSEDSSMDPTKESTYEFLDRFVGEMATLFPDVYFHVGGDSEDAVTEWTTNTHIQRFMREHQLRDANALQVFFTSRLHAIVAKHGKTMVGWDEVLTPTTPKDVVVQSWRGLDSLGISTGADHRGLLSWGYYLDLNEPASRHFEVDPFDKPLSLEQQANVLGGETVMWTEYVTPETIDGRIWPRAAAVAERLWSPQGDKDLDSMYSRLDILSQHLALIDLPFDSMRANMYHRMMGNSDLQPLSILASVLEPPKGFPREGTRDYTVYTSLNHLSDAIPAESDVARQFRKIAAAIAAGEARPPEVEQAKTWLTEWSGNDARLRPLLGTSDLTVELLPVSAGLSKAADIGLAALASVQSGYGLDNVQRSEYLNILKSLEAPTAELTNMIVPGVEILVAAAKRQSSWSGAP